MRWSIQTSGNTDASQVLGNTFVMSYGAGAHLYVASPKFVHKIPLMHYISCNALNTDVSSHLKSLLMALNTDVCLSVPTLLSYLRFKPRHTLRYLF